MNYIQVRGSNTPLTSLSPQNDKKEPDVPPKKQSPIPSNLTTNDSFSITGKRSSGTFSNPFESLVTNASEPEGEIASLIFKNKKEIIEIPDYSNTKSRKNDLDRFKKDISIALNSNLKNIEIIHEGSVLKAKLKDSGKIYELSFKNKADMSRMTKYALLSESLDLESFGKERAGSKIKIVDYEDELTKESQIQLFKDDVAREMKADIKRINVFILDNSIIARNIETNRNYLIEFEDDKDFNRFFNYAKEGKSIRLEDFGQKRVEGSISLGGSTGFPDPKGKADITQSISYTTFLGETGIHKLKIDLNTNAGLTKAPNLDNIQSASITYSNSDLPLTGTAGEIKVTYKQGGSFGVDGKYEYLDLKVEKWGKEIEKNLKDKNPETITTIVATVAAVGVGIYAASELLPEAKNFDIPIKTKVYSNGINEFKVNVVPNVTIGGGDFAVALSKGGAEISQNIASGTNMREMAVYDVAKKELTTEFEANHDRGNVKITNIHSFDGDPKNDKTLISIGKSHTIGDNINMAYAYSQELDSSFKPHNQSLSASFEYAPNDSWRFSVGGGLSLPEKESKLNYSVNARTTYKF